MLSEIKQLHCGTSATGSMAVNRSDVLQRADLFGCEKIKLYNSALYKFLRLTRQNESEKDKLNIFYHLRKPQHPQLL